MMNDNKKNIVSGDWILCPSKTFPGKFYYFNVVNGEAAWSLGDAEKKIIKTIPKVQESHHHPEPSNPPTEPTITKLSLQHPKPIFGQSVFPKVLPKPTPYENVIWTPFHRQVPIAVPSQSQTNDPKLIPKAVKQKTVWDFNKDLLIHASSMPLSKRLVNFVDPVIKFDQNNKIQNKLQFDEFYMSKTNKAKNIASSNFSQKKGLSFSDLKPQKQLIKEAVFNIEIPSETAVVQQIEPEHDSNEVGIMERQNRDLRHLLMAKKRKTQVNSEEIERKKLKTMAMECTSKKKVSFNLDHEDIELDDNDDMNFRVKYLTTVEILRNLSGTVVDEWFIVVDGEILLDEFSFLNRLVQLDPQCKLVIPSSALSYVSAATRGDHATAARSVLRRLDPPYIIVQSDDVTGKPNDAIIKSCVDAMYRNTHVVLISKDIELMAYAKCYPIHCYHISTIKNGLTPKPEYKQNMKITVRNTEANLMKNRPAENLFEDLNERQKETLTFEQNKVNLTGNDCTTPVGTNKKSRIVIEHSKILNKSSLFDQCSRNAKSNTSITNLMAPNPITTKIAMSYQKINLQDSKTMYPRYSPENSIKSQNNTIQDPKMNSLNHLFNTAITKRDENTSKMLTDWRYAESDDSDTSIEMDFQNLNLKEKYQTTHKKDTLNKNVSYFTHHSTPNINLQHFKRTLIFHNGCENGPDSNFEVQKSNFKTAMFQMNGSNVQNSNFDVPKSNLNTAMFQNGGENEHGSNFEVQKSNFKTAMFQSGVENEHGSNFEVQKSNYETSLSQRGRNYVQDSIFEVQKSNFKTAMFQSGVENEHGSNFEVQKSNYETSLSQRGRNYVQDSIFEVQKSNFKTAMFQSGVENEHGSNFEVQKSNYETSLSQRGRNYVQDSIFEVQKSNFKTAMFQSGVENKHGSNFEVQKSNFKTAMLQSGVENVHGSNIEVQNSNYETSLSQRDRNYVQDSNFEVQKSNFEVQKSNYETSLSQRGRNYVQDSNFRSSIFPNSFENDSNVESQKSKEPQYENNVFKKENKPQNITKSNNNIDLSNFIVNNKVMDNRLNERMDEFVCTYKQIMEEFLSSILGKVSPRTFKSMAPPWSLYEALQCTKNIYKDHIMMKNIIDQLTGFLYESEHRKDKMKMVLTPSEFMKAVGCGVHLIQYLKTILQPSSEILESEQNLLDMINNIKNPVYDINEPLVKTPVEFNPDYKEIRQNFIKKRTDIISYLKKHYPDWQSYEEIDNKMKIVRTFGRNLNMLKLGRVKETNTDMVMKNIDVATKTTDVMKNVENVNKIDGIKLPTFKDTTKNIGVLVCDTNKSCKDIEKNECVRKLNMNKQDDNNKDKEMNQNEKDIPKGIKIIRNLHLIEEFEQRLKHKNMLEFESSSISSTYTDHENKHLHTNCNNDQIDCKDNFTDHTKDLNVSVNKLNGQDVIKNLNDNYGDEKNHYNDIKIDEKQKESEENYSQSMDNRENDVNDPKKHKDNPESGKIDPNNYVNKRKSDKDDMTNDSGLGNESPRLFSVVKSFSFELENSLEKMRTYIEGSLREFRQGKLNEDAKKIFQLKAFETNFHITRIISRLNKFVRNNCEVSNDKINPKNLEIICKCLEQADMLQKALNMILTVTNDSSLVELNSSMSLNLS